MLQRAITIFALALLLGGAAVGQTAPVIDGQTGAVTITPQTLEWLRRQLAEEEDRLRQLQVAIRQIERALAASQVTAETLIPPPGSQATTGHTPAPTPELPPVVATPIPPASPRAAIVPRPPFPPPPSQSQTPHTAPIVPAPRISTPAPVAATPSRVVPSLEELVSSPAGTAPPVAVATPPVGGDPQPAPASSRPPRIMIPTFAPRGAPGSAASGVTDEIDRSGSPVPLPPGAEGDEPIEFPAIPGASATTDPSALPLVAPLRAGLTMAQVRQIKGTPALIRRDDASGTEVWTYDDTMLTFRGGRLDTFRVGAAEVTDREPVAGPAVANTPAAEHRREPVAWRGTTRMPERQRLAMDGSVTQATERAQTQKRGSRVETEPTSATSKASESRRSERVARWRGSTQRTRPSWRSRRTARAYHSRRTTRSYRWTRAARQYRMRRWARQHQRSHRWALRNQPAERRAAIMAECRKCRIAQRYLLKNRRGTSSRVASWRSTTRAPRQARSAKAHQVKIIQRH